MVAEAASVGARRRRASLLRTGAVLVGTLVCVVYFAFQGMPLLGRNIAYVNFVRAQSNTQPSCLMGLACVDVPPHLHTHLLLARGAYWEAATYWASQRDQIHGADMFGPAFAIADIAGQAESRGDVDAAARAYQRLVAYAGTSPTPFSPATAAHYSATLLGVASDQLSVAQVVDPGTLAARAFRDSDINLARQLVDRALARPALIDAVRRDGDSTAHDARAALCADRSSDAFRAALREVTSATGASECVQVLADWAPAVPVDTQSGDDHQAGLDFVYPELSGDGGSVDVALFWTRPETMTDTPWPDSVHPVSSTRAVQLVTAWNELADPSFDWYPVLDETATPWFITPGRAEVVHRQRLPRSGVGRSELCIDHTDSGTTSVSQWIPWRTGGVVAIGGTVRGASANASITLRWAREGSSTQDGPMAIRSGATHHDYTVYGAIQRVPAGVTAAEYSVQQQGAGTACFRDLFLLVLPQS